MRARLQLPGSKSITNRALILAALADGPSRITGPLRARDTELMAAAVSSLGANVTAEPGNSSWLVTPGWLDGRVAVDVGNAGTVLRFVPPAAVLGRAEAQFRGDARASQRPVGQLLTALRELGAAIADDGRGALPFTISGRGRLPGGTVTLTRPAHPSSSPACCWPRRAMTRAPRSGTRARGSRQPRIST